MNEVKMSVLIMPENMLCVEKSKKDHRWQKFYTVGSVGSVAMTYLTSAFNNTVSKCLGVFPSICWITC